MDEIGPEQIERRLREDLAALMDVSSAAEAEVVRRGVVALAPVVDLLDGRIAREWVVRRLFGYVDWRSRDALGRQWRWLEGEQASIDRALLSILDQSRPGRSSEEIHRARDGLERVRERIDQLEPGAPHSQALHNLLGYTAATSATALELAEQAELHRVQHAVERPVSERAPQQPDRRRGR